MILPVSLSAAWQFQVLGLPARLVRPEALLFLLATVMVALLWALYAWSRHKALSVVPARHLAKVAPGAGVARDVLGGAFGFAGLLLLSIAATQPQCGSRSVVAKRFGIDLVIALDASNSMTARDVRPSRLERAKLELGGLIDRLGGDRVGLVAFAGDAFVQCPLTTDYAAAKLFLKAIDPNALPQQGTSLSAALATSKQVLEAGDRGAGARAIVVITDGEDHEGDLEALAEQLAEDGIQVFAVGVGSSQGEPIPLLNKDGSMIGYRKDRSGQTILTKLNSAPLEMLAEKTGGLFVASAMGDLGVAAVHERLDKLDKAELETRLSVQYDHRHGDFAWPGAALLALGFATGEGALRRRRNRSAAAANGPGATPTANSNSNATSNANTKEASS